MIDAPRPWRVIATIDRLEFDIDLPPAPPALVRLDAWFDLLTEGQRIAAVILAMLVLAATSMYLLGLGSTVMVNRAEAELLALMPTPEPTVEPSRQPTATVPPRPTATLPRPTVVLPTFGPLPTPVPAPVLPPVLQAPVQQPQQARPAIAPAEPLAPPTRPRLVATPEPTGGTTRVIPTVTRGAATPSGPAPTPARTVVATTTTGPPSKPQAAPTVFIPAAPPAVKPTQPPLFAPTKPGGPTPSTKPGVR